MPPRTLALLVLAIAAVFLPRFLGPNDIDGKDAPRTCSYTADIAEHGRWAAPRDMLGHPATKPPLYNWLSLPVCWGMGIWSTWSLKLPTVLATCAIAWLVFRAAGPVAVAAFLANTSTYRLLYIARPDMLCAFFLFAAWLLAESLLRGGLRRDRAMLLWACVAGAALTKGPPALLPILYIPLSARLLHGRWGHVARTGLAWGLPLALALTGAWAFAAWRANPDYFIHDLLGTEVLDRVAGTARRWGWKDNLWRMPAYFVGRFAPWSIVFLVALRRERRAPEVLWVGLIVVFFSLSAGQRDDYLLPAYPAAAILVARRIERRPRLVPVALAVAIAYGVGAGVNDFLFKDGLKDRLGDHVVDFAKEIRERTGEDPVVFANTGYNPLQALLGRNQASALPSPEALAAARWVVRPVLEGRPPVVVSEDVPRKHLVTFRLGLYERASLTDEEALRGP